ncbi:MAG: ATP-binding protein [Longimicrobiales bacterium]|nr:ATP-binding protein [Longimicrobiales bacterium]
MMVETASPVRILVAEDDAIVGRDIGESLEGLGYEVAGHVTSGEAAVQAARDLRVDLVLMDIRMPGLLDGIEAAHRIGADADVPVVYLTAYSDDRTVARAKETAPFGYLVKPFDDRELKTTVETALYRHRMEGMLRESRRRYRDLFEGDIAAHYVSTPEGKLLAANEAFALLLGADSVDDALDTPAVAFYPTAEDREAFLELVRDRGSVAPRRSTLRRLDGTEISILHGARGVTDSRGHLIEIHGSVVDMTRESQLEERLRRSSRMEAVTRLAGGIAHDFNNLLTGIRGSVELVLDQESLSEEGIEDLATVLEACDRAQELVQGLLAAGKPDLGKNRGPVDVVEAVRDITSVLTRLISSGPELRMELPDGSLFVEGNATQIQQVVLNLVLNARDALPEKGGVVRVSVEAVPEPDPMELPEGPDDRRRAPGGWIRLTVRDTGSGMDEVTRERIFDPFYSTKKHGTGLGLAVVYGVVRDHGGDILVESASGKGTTFRVYLPALG